MKLLSSAKSLVLLSMCVEEAGFSKSFFPYFELQPKEGFFFFLRGKISTSENDEFLTAIFLPAVCYRGKGRCQCSFPCCNSPVAMVVLFFLVLVHQPVSVVGISSSTS